MDEFFNMLIKENWKMLKDYCLKKRVHSFYWDEDINCATTTIKVLSEVFSLKLSDQVIDAALGMHGAGGYRAQCGLVEGALMFIGIMGRSLKIDDESTIAHCRDFAGRFEKEFGSLSCRVLRPEGFKENQPPHICEELTSKAVTFSMENIKKAFKI